MKTIFRRAGWVGLWCAVVLAAVGAAVKVSEYPEVTEVRTNDYFLIARPDLGTNVRISGANLYAGAGSVGAQSNLVVVGQGTTNTMSALANGTLLTVAGAADSCGLMIKTNGSLAMTNKSGLGAPVALGGGGNAGNNGVCLGYGATATGTYGFATHNSFASGQYAIGMGSGWAWEKNDIAIGEGAVAGVNAGSGHTNIVCIGKGAVCTNSNTMLIGGSTPMNLIVSGGITASNVVTVVSGSSNYFGGITVATNLAVNQLALAPMATVGTDAFNAVIWNSNNAALFVRNTNGNDRLLLVIP